MKPSEITIPGIKGTCGRREVFMGFAPANLLHSISFADVLNEDTGDGYQRKFNQKHSVDFRKYIRTPYGSTIPLTFNLRPESEKWWEVQTEKSGQAALKIVAGKNRILSQVDCQHRLGSLGNPPANGTKYFATGDLLETAKDRSWLVKMTTAINQHWQRQNARKKCRSVNGSENGHSRARDLAEVDGER